MPTSRDNFYGTTGTYLAFAWSYYHTTGCRNASATEIFDHLLLFSIALVAFPNSGRLSHESTIVRKIDFFSALEMFVSILFLFFVKSNRFLWNKSRLSNCWPGIGYNFSDKHIQSQERKIDFNGKREAAALMRFLTQQDSKNSGFQTCHSSQFRFVGLVICPPPPFFSGVPPLP